jgi:hypothetical protein
MTTRRRVRVVVTSVLLIASGFTARPAVRAQPAAPVDELEFLGQQIIETGTLFQGTQVGGLSSIAYDSRRDVFYALSDDPSQFNPARIYTLRLDASDGTLDAGDIDFLAVTTLRDTNGQTFAPFSLDPEGIALTKDDEVVITSEGIANQLIDPFVARFSLDGRQLGVLPVPASFLPNSSQTRGVRQNLGFESAVTAPNGRFLFTGVEGALVQDGPAASLTAGSPARLLRYNLQTGRVDRQHLYWTDAIAEPPVPAGSFAVNGLVELLALNNENVLAMERSFSVGAPDTGNTIKLYAIKLAGADNINGVDCIAATLDEIRPVDKTLLVDLDDLAIPLDNVEGMAFGPELRDGRRSLLLVSDNNFSATGFTQFLLFAISP